LVTLIISASAGCSLFLLGMYLYQRYGLPAIFESLRGGRWHFFVLGAATVLIMSHQGFHLHSYTPALKGLLGIGLTWIGFRAGLDFDFRQLQQANPGQVRTEVILLMVSFVALFSVLSILVPPASPQLVDDGFTYVAVLVLSVIGLTARSSGFFGVGTGKPIAPVASPVSFMANPAAVLLLCLLYPVVSTPSLGLIGPFRVTGYLPTIAVLASLGLLLGIMVDFVFRAHRNGQRCTFLTLSACAAITGPCLQLGFPVIVAGFVGGVWVINTTVRKREIAELSEYATSIVEPIFVLTLGALIAGHHSPVSIDPSATAAVALAFLLLRGLARTSRSLAALVPQTKPPRGQNHSLYAWLPMGRTSIGLIAQLLLFPMGGATLSAGLLLAVALSQSIVLPGRVASVSRGTQNGTAT